MIEARVIADSISPARDRITSLEVTMPRIILAEFNTHRVFSRNSASSRAIPHFKMVQSVVDNPFLPIAWQKAHKGMQGEDYFEDPDEIDELEDIWLRARNLMADISTELHKKGVTKQLTNRLLEPFLYHTVLVTSTEWDNFFNLRIHKDAEIHIRRVAEKIKEAMNKSEPKELEFDEWHIPFGDEFDEVKIQALLVKSDRPSTEQMRKIEIATARCARISYRTYGSDPKIDYDADIRLHDSLLKAGHMSPFEHCARAVDAATVFPGETRNLWGWIPYRHFVENGYTGDALEA